MLLTPITLKPHSMAPFHMDFPTLLFTGFLLVVLSLLAGLGHVKPFKRYRNDRH